MTSLREFQKQRTKVVVPKEPSLRPYRRLMRDDPMRAAFRGIVPRQSRVALAVSTGRRHQRHNNIMDPFRFKEHRHPQARKLERIARRIAYEVGWRIRFDARGVMHFET